MNEPSGKQRFCLGIVGGMGPLSGVHFQELLIEETAVSSDQDHIPVICYTNPGIPDRTESLARDNGASFAAGIIESIRVLERAGATLLAITCNTAHTRFQELERATRLPILHIVELAAERMAALAPRPNAVGILATDGTLREELYARALANCGMETRSPQTGDQAHVMHAIYRIKAGTLTAEDIRELQRVTARLRKQGAQALVLGCTELSLYARELRAAGFPVFDPLRILAQHIVRLWTAGSHERGRALTASRGSATVHPST